MYKLCVFAGTTEGRELVALLAGQPVAVTACVATEYGETLLEPRENLAISTGRLTEDEMAALLGREGFDCVVDATHPYAAQVTENIAAACRTVGVDCLRLLRGSDAAPEDAVCVPDIPGAVAYLAKTEGNILLTTGSKELAQYTALPDFARREYARVLPMDASLAACRAAGLPPDRIIAMQGPFSQEMNTAMLRSVSAGYLVTKDTGGAGGFGGKAAAAREAGAVLVVVGRPAQRAGLDFAGVTEELCRRFGLRLRPQVALVGIGPGGAEAMTGEARRALGEAGCLIGARRMLEAAAASGQRTCEAITPADIAACIQEQRDCRRFAVALSGDTGFFSGAKKLLPLLEGCDVTVQPGLSSLSVLCARLGTSYEDIVCASLHGRDSDILPDVSQNRRVFVLVGGADGVSGLCRSLAEAGLGDVRVHVGERLGYPDERITVGPAAELAGRGFDSLSAVLLENASARPFAPGLRDGLFARGGGPDGRVVPMTKSEVRAVALSRLELTADAVCWDIGAGTGSVAVEMALFARRGRVYAVERNPAALELLRENRARFHVSNLEVIPGSAPEACRALPAPTHAFIGGSAGNLREIVSLLLEKNPAVRIVAAAVTLETAAELAALMGEFGSAQAVALSAARSRAAGPYHLMAGQNPVTLFTFQR